MASTFAYRPSMKRTVAGSWKTTSMLVVPEGRRMCLCRCLRRSRILEIWFPGDRRVELEAGAESWSCVSDDLRVDAHCGKQSKHPEDAPDSEGKQRVSDCG